MKFLDVIFMIGSWVIGGVVFYMLRKAWKEHFPEKKQKKNDDIKLEEPRICPKCKGKGYILKPCEGTIFFPHGPHSATHRIPGMKPFKCAVCNGLAEYKIECPRCQ